MRLAVDKAKDAGRPAAHRRIGGQRNRPEHRRGVGGRTRDHLQNIGSRRLALERRLDLARARLHFGEQACVLDGDDGLIGEGLNEIYFGVAERPLGSAGHHERPYAPLP